MHLCQAHRIPCTYSKISWKCLQTLQKKSAFTSFLFLWNERVTLGLQPLPVDCHVPHGNLATPKKKRKKKKTKKQVGATTAESSFCVEAIVFTKASRLLLWTRIGLSNRRSQCCLSPLQQVRKTLFAAMLASFIVAC